MQQFTQKFGHYLGTEIERKWWRRYRNGAFFARGIGECELDSTTLAFTRNLSETTLHIPLSSIEKIRVGKWHVGRWAGGAPVVKLDWKNGTTLLSSGFVFSREGLETAQFIHRIETAIRHVNIESQ